MAVRNGRTFEPPRRLRALFAAQKQEGFLSQETIAHIALDLKVPQHELYGLASFFPYFHLTPPAHPRIRICRDLSCHLAGSEALLEEAPGLIQKAQFRDGQPESCPCLGHCDGAPAAEIGGRIYTSLNSDALQKILNSWTTERPRPATRPQRVQDPDAFLPTSAEDHAFDALRTLRRRGEPGQVIEILQKSDLRGMGGAGFPTGRKWATVREAEGEEKYVICNADESEPGTFKDRAILDTFPGLVVEGVLIAAWAIGARQVIFFIRHEYSRQRRSLARAMKKAREEGFIGGPDAPEAEIFVSPGGYICGEETALLEVLEDRRAEPRERPPFPATSGLFGKPTIVNNVETFALVSMVLEKGAEWYTSFGTNGSKGLTIFGISGPVNRPGVYVAELGTPIRTLFDEKGGGLHNGLTFKGFCPGGPSSGFLPAKFLDLPYSYQALSEAGSMMGSGALVAVPEGSDMVALAHNTLRFFRDESCGKCVPCRIGTQKITTFLETALAGDACPEEVAGMEDIASTMADASICGLGQAAPLPFHTLLRHFRVELEAKWQSSKGA
jgi:NADH:ubiquinone oxidoreductase subunit F (NADH-binding)